VKAGSGNLLPPLSGEGRDELPLLVENPALFSPLAINSLPCQKQEQTGASCGPRRVCHICKERYSASARCLVNQLREIIERFCLFQVGSTFLSKTLNIKRDVFRNWFLMRHKIDGKDVNAEERIIEALTRSPEGLNQTTLVAVTELDKSTVSNALPRLKKRRVLVTYHKKNTAGKLEKIHRLRHSPLQQWARKNALLARHEKKLSNELQRLLQALVDDAEYVRVATEYQVYRAALSGNEAFEVLLEQVGASGGAWGKSQSEAIERLVTSIQETAREETSWVKTVGIRQDKALLPRPLIRQTVIEAVKKRKLRLQNLSFITPSHEHKLDQAAQALERDLLLRIENTRRQLDREHGEAVQKPAVTRESETAANFRSKVLEMVDDLTTRAINIENNEMLKTIRAIYLDGQTLVSLYGEEMASLHMNKIRNLVNAHWAFFSKMSKSRSELLRKMMQDDNLPRQAWHRDLDAGGGLPVSKTGAVPLP
jgi:hypothetical protein